MEKTHLVTDYNEGRINVGMKVENRNNFCCICEREDVKFGSIFHGKCLCEECRRKLISLGVGENIVA